MNEKQFKTLKKVFRFINENFYKYPANTTIHIILFEFVDKNYGLKSVCDTYDQNPRTCKKRLVSWFYDLRYNIASVDIAFESPLSYFECKT